MGLLAHENLGVARLKAWSFGADRWFVTAARLSRRENEPATIAIKISGKAPFCDPQSERYLMQKSSPIDRCSIHVIDSCHSANAPKPQEKTNCGSLGSQSAKTVSRYLVDQFVVAGCI
jgi:hypothetical protein